VISRSRVSVMVRDVCVRRERDQIFWRREVGRWEKWGNVVGVVVGEDILMSGVG
jgi:hypothetical protein